MCSQDTFHGTDKQQQEARESGDGKRQSWSRERAERLARRHLISLPHISETSEESSAGECANLPDLEDLPDINEPALFHKTSTPKKANALGSLQRRQSKERHFLDSFEPPAKQRRVAKESGTKSTSQVRLTSEDGVGRSQAEEPEALNDTEEDSGCLTQMSPCVTEDLHSGAQSVSVATTPREVVQAHWRQRRRDRISQELQAGSLPIHRKEYRVFTFPADTVCTTTFERRAHVVRDQESQYTQAKFSGIIFLRNMTAYPSTVDNLCSDFVKLQTSCLDDFSDDLSDPCNFSNCIDLLQDFCSKRKPSAVIIDRIICNGFFSVVDSKISIQSYHVVLRVWQQFPDLIRIDPSSVLLAGDVLQKYLQNSGPSAAQTSSSSRFGQGRPSFPQSRLYFQLVVKGLQLNLCQCTLADQKSVSKSLAFVCLSSEGSRPLLKQVTHWLEFCLVVRHPEHAPVARLWLCELQTLLGVSVLVSRDRQEAAKQLAPGLKRTYKYLTDLGTKKLFLQSFACPLLCFYVLRLIMEDQCESTILSSQFPASIQEVVHNYFLALPPQDHLTPPPSPSEEEGDDRRGQYRMYSLQSCEELAMLVFFISKSFIACKQGRLNSDLRHQILKGPRMPSLTPEQINDLMHSVREFRTHLQNHTHELSTATQTYLNLLECLCVST